MTTIERRPTQEDLILRVLIDAYPGWVPLPRILDLHISQYSARIWTLRHKRGYDIENKLVDLPDGRKGGQFRRVSLLPNPEIADSPALVPASPTPRTKHTRQQVEQPQRPATVGLFANDPTWQADETMRRRLQERRYD